MLLSRVADNLYWMSRYLERAEHTARLIDLSLNLMLEQAPAVSERRWQRLLRGLNVDYKGHGDAYAITQHLTFDPTNDNSIVSCIANARENAQHVRELVSSEMWEQVNGLYLFMKRTRLDDIWNDRPHEFFRSVKDGSHLFQGITDSTMTQGEGWLFIQVGRYIERATSLAALLDQHFSEFTDIQGVGDTASDYLEWVGLLKCCTAFEAYCKVYTADLRVESIAEFLELNQEFPHAIGFAVKHLQSCLHDITEATESHRAGRLNKLAGRLSAMLEYGQIDEIFAGEFHAYFEQVQAMCAQIHTVIYNTYIAYPIEKELTA